MKSPRLTQAAIRLRRYCEEHGLTQEEFGTRVGIDQFHVSKLMCGTRRAGRSLAVLVQRATEGYVAISDWDEPAVERKAS